MVVLATGCLACRGQPSGSVTGGSGGDPCSNQMMWQIQQCDLDGCIGSKRCCGSQCDACHITHGCIDPFPATVGSSTSAAATTSTGATVCVDPGAPPGSKLGTQDCSGTDCYTAPCEEYCSALYDCGLATCSGMAQLCPGFAGTAAEHDAYVGPSSSPGCIENCHLLYVDPTNCAGTIDTAKSQSVAFADFCNNGGGG